MTEAKEQAKLAAYLDHRGYRWCHVPNGGYRHKGTARKLKIQGVKAGIPDILIFSGPDGEVLSCAGIAIELKIKGGRVSPNQREWLATLDGLGWRTFIAYGAGDAIRLLDSAM
jgi:hypothetical protein